jgi:hypothetical protein
MASINESLGGTVFPADIGTDKQATSLDPAREVITGLIRQAIISELGTAWTQVTNTIGGRWAGTSPVQDTLEIQPTAQAITERKSSLPLLCVYRMGSPTFETHSTQKELMTQEWGVVWILGQADIAERRKLSDFLQAGAKLIRLVTEKRWHPDYDGGVLQFFSNNGAIGKILLTGVEFEPAQINDKEPTEWLILSCTLQTLEYSYVDLTVYDNAEFNLNHLNEGNPDDGYIEDFINTDSRYTG